MAIYIRARKGANPPAPTSSITEESTNPWSSIIEQTVAVPIVPFSKNQLRGRVLDCNLLRFAWRLSEHTQRSPRRAFISSRNQLRALLRETKKKRKSEGERKSRRGGSEDGEGKMEAYREDNPVETSCRTYLIVRERSNRNLSRVHYLERERERRRDGAEREKEREEERPDKYEAARDAR